jgi:surface protein
VLFVGVLGAITLFTNMSFTGGPTLASAAVSSLTYSPDTKTLTVEPGELPADLRNKTYVNLAETIVFLTNEQSDKVVAPQNSVNLFYGLTNLKRFQGMQNLDTSNVTSMSSMFYGCTSLTELDLSSFNTSEVTNMNYMFYNCKVLPSVDVSGFNTPKVVSMRFMFSNCHALTSVDVSRFNTSEVTTMENMFDNCKALTAVDVSEFDTAKVESMYNMFSGCNSLTELDLSRFDTSQVTYMQSMFSNTTALWKLTLGPDFVFNDQATGLLDPVVGTKFNENFVVTSNQWLQTTELYVCTAAQIPTEHVKGHTDTFAWQGDRFTTAEYVVQPTYTITIPATITIPSATVAGTGVVTLSAYPKVPYEERFIHISAASGTPNPWHLTTTGDATGAEYDFYAEGGVNLKAGFNLVLEADGEAPAITKTVSASLTDNTHKFKYAGAYKDTVTFTIQTAAS